jgi:3',5'-cyclic AMP phosphodiesterase CpdA
MTGVPDTTLLAQLSDPHVDAGPSGDAAARALAAAVAAVLELDPAPDAVLLSGDLVNDPGEEAYARVRDLLAPLPMPLHVVAGNHDDPDGLRAAFGAPGQAGEPLQYEARVGKLRLLVCDTTVGGAHHGALDGGRLEWLAARLQAARDTPTVVAMHHPPLMTGAAAMDELALVPADRTALGELLAGHPQVLRVVCGHVHCAAVGSAGNRPVLTAPSTHLQLRANSRGRIELAPDPPGFLLHLAHPDGLTSRVQPILRA